MEKQEIVKLLQTKYKKYMDNDDLEGLVFAAPANQRSAIASFLMYDVGIDLFSQMSEIPDRMLQLCDKVDTVLIPSNIKSIGPNAFEGSSISKIKIDDNSPITTIPANCFKDCKNLKVVILPKSVTKIKEGAFRNCDNIKYIVTPKRQTRSEKIQVPETDRSFLQSRLAEVEGTD